MNSFRRLADSVRCWKIDICPRSDTLRANVKFCGQSISQGHHQPTYQKARSGFIYFITLPLIIVSRVDSKLLVPFLVLSGEAFEIIFLMLLPVNPKNNEFVLHPCKNNKHEKARPLSWLCFFSTKIIRGHIYRSGVSCEITVRLFCITWRKVANRVVRKAMCGLESHLIARRKARQRAYLSCCF